MSWSRRFCCIGLLCAVVALATGTAMADEALHVRLAGAVGQAGQLESSKGETLLPPGTTFDSVHIDDRNVVCIALTLPVSARFEEMQPARIAALQEVLARAVGDELETSGVSIRVRIGSGAYRPIEACVPPANDVRPEREVREERSTAGLKSTRSLADSEQVEFEAAQVAIGGPLANADGQPQGALSGVVVFCNAGHGWTAGSSTWFLQRGLVLDMVEDYGNLDQLNYFVNYLYNAGAVVVPFRPVGYQNHEIVLDNDDPGVTYSGSWSNSSATTEYYENNVTTSGVPYRFATANPLESSTARYTPTIPEDGFYPVYCWTRDGFDRVDQTYRVHHSGGTAAVVIDHQRVGKGWIWLGTYYFESGTAGYVEITNASPDGGVVIADAIRFGNGIGDIIGVGPGTVSGFPRDEEAARYWAESEAGNHAVGLPTSIWNCCSEDQSDNVSTAARWSREMNRTTENNDRWRRIYLEYHSNAAGCGGGPPCGAKGTVCLVSDAFPTTNQEQYASILGDKIESDMLIADSEFEFNWGTRSNPGFGAFGAISTNGNSNEFDATIVEVAFHDNVEDTKNLLNMKVRDAVARSTMQGMIMFLNNLSGGQVPLVFLPEPPERMSAVHNGSGGVVVSWIPGPSAVGTSQPVGHAAVGYKIYRSSNGYGFGNAVDVGNVLTTTLNDIPAGTTTYLRVAAYNAGGESMPTETIAVRTPGVGQTSTLIVNGFDRVSRQQNPIQTIPYGPMHRPIARRVNSFDYIVQHAKALAANGADFDSCANEAVISGDIELEDYARVVWILGEESSADDTFDSTEQARVTDYLNAGGSLFVTGAEIAWDLDNLGNGVSFFENVLGGNYVGDDGATFTATGSGGILGDVGNFSFSEASGAPYVAEFPDRIGPQAGASTVLGYVGGTGDSAGIQYDTGTYRVVMFGIPFETIASESVRNSVMERVLNFLTMPLTAVADFDFDGDVDLDDYAHLQNCYSGANMPQTEPLCRNAKLDVDTDVDSADMTLFLDCFSGAGLVADTACGTP